MTLKRKVFLKKDQFFSIGQVVAAQQYRAAQLLIGERRRRQEGAPFN